MTTILKAVQELERRSTRLGGQPIAASNDHKSRLRWATIGAGLVALSGAAIGGTLLIRGRPAPPAVPAQSTSTVRQPQAAPRETHRQYAAPHEPPHAAPQAAPRAAPQAAPQAAAQAAPLAPPPSDIEPQGKVEKVRPAAPPRAAALAPPKARPAPRQAALPREPSTHTTAPQDPAIPGLRVQSVSFSPAVGLSTVTLETSGAHRVTLHEGESADGFEVQLIQPNTVYLSHGGSVFAVNVAR